MPVKTVGIGLLAILTFVVFLMTYFTVDQNEATVVTSFGHISYVAEPGFHLKVPFMNNTETYRTDIQAMTPPGPVNTYTVDNQEVDVSYTVFYRIPIKEVPFIFENNRDYKARLQSMVTDRLKAAMGQVNVQSVAEKRGQLRDTIKKTLQHDAADLGIEITDFQLTDMQYTAAFRKAVNAAAVQKANIESVEYQRQQAEKTAQIAKTKAEGEANAVRAQAAGAADARLLQAKAEAQAIKVKGEAQAEAIKAQADALKANPDLVNLRKAERWDGKLPMNIYGSAPIPFMNVGGTSNAQPVH